MSDSDSDDEQRAGDVEPHQRHCIRTYQVLRVRLIINLYRQENLKNTVDHTFNDGSSTFDIIAL